jgi:hypothetical protein
MGGERVAERTLAVFRSSDVTGKATRTHKKKGRQGKGLSYLQDPIG